MMLLCVACGPLGRSPDVPPAGVLDVAPGSVVEVSPTLDVQVIRLQVAARVFVVQSNRVLQTVDIGTDGLPRDVSIPVATLRDPSGAVIYVVVSEPGFELKPDDHCLKCLYCCPSPPLVRPPIVQPPIVEPR